MAIVTASDDPVRATAAASPNTWHQMMRDAIRDPRELCRVLSLSPQIAEKAGSSAKDFSVFAPHGFVAKMKPGDPKDPLLRQVLPLEEEAAEVTGFALDPVGDAPATVTPGLIKKYHGRALLISTGACAIHCRYCFRRHFPYSEGPRSMADWQPALDRIAADSSIEEILLSGGDPLTIVDSQLAELSRRLADIEHVRRLRIHTRLPIVIPERVTDEFLGWLTGSRLVPIVVVHANHPAELDQPVAEALGKLVDAGILLLNQAVLLRGVNDQAKVLIDLSRRLVDLRVMPYYLHQLDRVAGAAHFEVPVDEGIEMIEQMRARLPGYAVPRYVQETAGATSKTVLI